MLTWLRRWFGIRRPEATPALSQAEALTIARGAAAGDSLAEHLTLVSLRQREGKPVWLVSSATIGLVLEVTVDAETGAVLDKKTLGKR